MATYVPPKKNTAFVFYVSLTSQANPSIFQANPTLAAGDVLVATDDGAPANITTLPVVDADFTKRVKVSLSASEMNGDSITVIFSDAAGAEWCDLILNLQTVANQLDDVATTDAAIKAKTDNLPAAPAATGDIPTAAQIVDAMYRRRIVLNRDAGTVTVYAADGTTVIATGPLTTDVDGAPIASVNPAAP